MNLAKSRSHIFTTIPGKSLNVIHVLKLNLLPVPSPQHTPPCIFGRNIHAIWTGRLA